MLKLSAKIFIAVMGLVLFVPSLVFARIGVGVGSGKINVVEKMKPGKTYELPVLSVLNTGDEPSDYEVSVEYLEGTTELWPERSWFKFTPETFYLEPGQVKNVKVELNLPVKAVPGDYFAFLEGHPAKKSRTTGGAAIGVAAAAKLNFTIVPANILQAVYYRATTIYKQYHPYDTAAIAVLVVVYLIYWFKKNFKFQMARK